MVLSVITVKLLVSVSCKMDALQELKDMRSKAKQSFPYFIKHIFPLSFKKTRFVRASHTWEWAKRIQNNKNTATLSARKHLKSTTIHAFVMWKIFRMEENSNERWLYMSYNQPMSVYHTQDIKNYIQANPHFAGIKDLSPGGSTIHYTWNNNDSFRCTPSSILRFNRGWHGKGVICDDILADPTNELNFTIIDKITRVFNEQVMSLPEEGGEVHLVGTAQHQMDLFFKLKDNPHWNWAEYKAILNEKNKEILWPELFSYERLCQIRTNEIGEKAFNKEYMCVPIWSEEAYFQRTEIMNIVKEFKTVKRPASEWKERMSVVAGLDIGKKAHPSHLVVFQLKHGFYTQIFEMFMERWDYSKQVDYINDLIKFYQIDELRYDDTRSEMEGFRERGLLGPEWIPIVFGAKNKFDMASNFSRLVNQNKITLLNKQRQIDSILSVNNELQAPETSIGHGDAFWSVGLALYKEQNTAGYLAI